MFFSLVIVTSQSGRTHVDLVHWFGIVEIGNRQGLDVTRAAAFRIVHVALLLESVLALAPSDHRDALALWLWHISSRLFNIAHAHVRDGQGHRFNAATGGILLALLLSIMVQNGLHNLNIE